MKTEDILELIRAGYTKEEIMEMEGEPVPAPDPAPAPALCVKGLRRDGLRRDRRRVRRAGDGSAAAGGGERHRGTPVDRRRLRRPGRAPSALDELSAALP